MQTIVITLSDELASNLRRLAAGRDPEPSLATLIEELLTTHILLDERLGGRAFRIPTKPLEITPHYPGSGLNDVGINHDAYIADDEFASWQRDQPSDEPAHE
jgi:hypothetical protein